MLLLQSVFSPLDVDSYYWTGKKIFSIKSTNINLEA